MSIIDAIMAQSYTGQKPEGEIRALKDRYQAKIESKASALTAKLDATAALEADLPESTEASIPDVEDIFVSAQSGLAQSETDLKAAQGAERGFAASHGLDRPARTPDWLVTTLALGFYCIGEGFINSFFFMNAHMSASQVAALFTSMLISLTNIAVSATAGYWVGRHLNYGERAMSPDDLGFKRTRTLAFIGLAVFLTAIGFFHLTVGLIRAQEELSLVQHSWAAYQTMLATPESVFLILIGYVMSALSFHKGKHGFDDPYPGYGARRRRVNRHRFEIADIQTDAKDEIEARFDDAIKATKKQSKATEKAFETYKTSVEDCHKRARELQASVANAESKLRTETARALSLFELGQGKSESSLSPDDLNALCTLSTPEIDLPAFRPPPTQSNDLSALTNAKTEALARLNRIFDRSEPTE